MVLYKALAPCRVGSYRETGEEFGWPRFEVCPAYLEEVAPDAEQAPASLADGGSPAGTKKSGSGKKAASAARKTEGTAAQQVSPGATLAEVFAAAGQA